MNPIVKTWSCISLFLHLSPIILCIPPPTPPSLILPLSTLPNLILPFNLTLPPNETLPLPPPPFSYTVPPPGKITIRFYNYGPAINRNRALICLGAARHQFLTNVDKYLDKPLNVPLEYKFRGVYLTIMSTGRSMTWAMDGATIRGLKFFIETYGAIGMLFDVEIMTKSGRLARLGTGRFAEFEGGL